MKLSITLVCTIVMAFVVNTPMVDSMPILLHRDVVPLAKRAGGGFEDPVYEKWMQDYLGKPREDFEEWAWKKQAQRSKIQEELARKEWQKGHPNESWEEYKAKTLEEFKKWQEKRERGEIAPHQLQRIPGPPQQ
ncbi:hypothetical protein BDF19DRAFT_467600 [Syncephalis fuscata]|nr:hypothetical protein BDF19DRAFT_467600 [Syncephalis fuscata]